MKMVNEVLTKAKGEGNVEKTLTGKGSFSQTGFNDLVSAMANDTTFKIPTYGKDGTKIGEVNVSELIRDDLKKTLEKAHYPQKSESGVLDSCEIVTNGLAKSISYIVFEQMKCGKKFDFPNTPTTVGSIYLNPVAGGTKVSDVRNPQTKENLGTVTVTSKDSVQIRAKSPVPKYLQTKVRKDPKGNVIK